MFETLSLIPSRTYLWREAERRGLRRVQLDNKTAETKSASNNALTTARVLDGRVSLELVCAISKSAIKGRGWRSSQLFRYWQFVTRREKGKVSMISRP